MIELPKLLIADSSDEFRQILFHTLSADYHIQTCRDGKQALQLLRTFRPSLMILDLTLPELDGISLLQRACEEGIQPAVLATGYFCNGYILSWLQRLPLSYFILKPCDLTAVADRLSDFTAQMQPAQLPTADIHAAIAEHLLRLGFSTHLDGFRFLQTAIPLYLRDPGQSMTKELYVSVGNAYQKDSRQVERSIRSAIDTAWQKGDAAVWAQYFGSRDGITPRPCASAFITRIATALEEQGYGRKSA